MARLRRNEIERRQHRRRQLFAAGGGSTEVTFPELPTVVLVLNNGTTLDISTDVRFESGVSIRRGRAANDSHVRTGNAVIKLNNKDGKYSPRNPTSVLYGLIGRNTQMYITRRKGIRFWGEIPEWPPEWTTGGLDAWVNLTIAGPLRRWLAPNAPTLQSAMTRSAIAANPVALWTLEDDTSAAYATAYNAVTTPPLFPQGTVTFGSVTDLAGATNAPNLGTAGVYLKGVTPTIAGSWGVEFAAKANVSDLNVMLRVTDTSGNYYDLFPPGTVFGVFPMQIAITGQLNQTFTAATHNFGSNAAFNNVWHYYAMYFNQSGTEVACTLYVDGVLSGSGISAGSVTLASPATVQISEVFTGATDGTFLSASHLTFFQGTTPSAIAASYLGYAGEPAGTRLQRLCRENGIAIAIIGDPADTMTMGFQGSERLIDLLYDCEDADMGFLSEARNSFGLSYRTLASMLNTPAGLQLNYTAGGNITLPLVPTDNDQRIINDSDVVLANGAGHTRYVLSTGPMSTLLPSAGGIGTYPENPTLNPNTTLNAGDIAGWHVNVGTVDLQRFDQVNVNVANTLVNHGLTVLADQMCALNTGDRIVIDQTPVWIGYDSLSLLMVGESEQFDQFRYTITYDTVLQEPYNVGVLDDQILGRLESDGTTVQDSHLSFETQFQGVTATGEIWTDSATNPDDFPFDIMVSGERMTVVSIVGTTNPQLWTVVRSINGVVKTIPANAPIYVRNPFRLSP